MCHFKRFVMVFILLLVCGGNAVAQIGVNACFAVDGIPEGELPRERSPMPILNLEIESYNVENSCIKIQKNMLVYTFPLDEQRIGVQVVFPVIKPLRDPVYSVMYAENASEKAFQEDGKPRCGAVGDSAFVIEYSKEQLLPGERSLEWFNMCVDVTKLERTYTTYFSWPYVSEEPGNDLFKSIVDTGYWKHLRYNLFMKNTYQKRDPKELELLYRWVKHTEEKNYKIEEMGYHFFFDNREVGADETLLEAPSTCRDEIQLTRLIFEYLQADENDTEEKFQAVLDFVNSRPFPQKVIMTFRIRPSFPRKGLPIADPFATFTEPEKEKLKRLDEALTEIRNKSIAEGVTN